MAQAGYSESELAAGVAAIKAAIEAGHRPGRNPSAKRVAADQLGWDRQKLDRVLTRAGFDWRAYCADIDRERGRPGAMPARGQTFLLTAAQDETRVHEQFWRNLHVYAAFLSARIMIGGFTYQKGLFEDHAVRTGVFVPEIQPYLELDRVSLVAGRLDWLAGFNILPTAKRPLADMEGLTGGAWGIVPHAKLQLDSVPVMPGAPAKILMTTGAATVANYIQRRAGQIAEHHHVIGATIVEVDADGSFFCRQISANADGSFQDLDRVVIDGRVISGATIEAATWGDIHRARADPAIDAGTWGIGAGTNNRSILDTLKPKHQFFHDTLDMRSRSHHTRGHPHQRALRRIEGHDSVEDEVRAAARFLSATRRSFATSVVVESNHDEMLRKWLADPAGASDPVNARYWHELNLTLHRALAAGEPVSLFERAARAAAVDRLDGVRFLAAGDSYTICQTVGGIENGLHGHIGPAGARGSPRSLARIAPKITAGHSHTPTIRDGYFAAGHSSLPDHDYNLRGPTTWARAHVLTYPDGKRAIVAMTDDGRWRGHQ